MTSEQVQKDHLRINLEKLDVYELQNVFSKMDSKGYKDQLRNMGSILIHKDLERWGSKCFD